MEIRCKPIFLCHSISHLKVKVLDLSTGRRKPEEWTFLPANWDHNLARRPVFDKNFVFLDFDTWGNLGTDTGDILILNLITRTKFWMRSGTLTTQLMEKAAGEIGLEGFMVRSSYASQMNVEKDRIVIKYKIQGYGYSTLGWFSNPYISKYVN